MSQECQIMIWGPPVLKESEWSKHGFDSLKSYIESELKGNEKALKTCSPDRRAYINTLPLVSFGYIDGDTQVQALVCNTLDDLPADSIPNVLEFDGNAVQG